MAYPPLRSVVDDSDLNSLKYECNMWQDDDIMRRRQPPVIRPWRDDEIIGELDSSTEPLPPDVFVLLFQYNCDHVLHAYLLEVEEEEEEDSSEGLECCYWMRKSCIIGDNDGELLYTVKRLREIIHSFGSYFSSREVNKMVIHIMACALGIREENQNNGREGVSCLCDIRASRVVYEDVEIDDSVGATIMTEDEDAYDDEGLIEENSIDITMTEDEDAYDDEGLIEENSTTISESAARLAIESLPKVEIKVSGNESCPFAGSCAVCWDEILTGDEVIWIPCSHFYHGRCITEWLLRKNTCPLCRFVLNLETEVDEGTEEN